VFECRYRIVVKGGLGSTARQAFDGLKIEWDGLSTALIGDMDQAALFGCLHRVQSLRLELIEIRRVEDHPSFDYPSESLGA
jgi:hypothetical protein